MAVPPTSEAATLLSTYILAELKKILSVRILMMYFSTFPDSSPKFYLSLLRRTELAGDLKALLFSNVEESAKDVAPEVSLLKDTESSTEQSAYPMVQPMKAALYFDNANRFGEWRILISTEAHNIYSLTVKRTKKYSRLSTRRSSPHLSHGQFSTNNHMRLNGSDAGIPVFEAKMTKDLRLVVDVISQKLRAGDNLFLSQYQIDCVPDLNGEFERQDKSSKYMESIETPSSAEYGMPWATI
ncbi:hypothetical protein DFJ58DRAFT_727835 [Suillus subalutaceus]|uniref:uncharacterized protein n=1 Tax=Suillus subalutaceus TaxID=48586 RepID=UPI001B860204|nr:uncharacterized protein DFJ58DRAFT_727835 [Suillus subalutaceus]KAG1854856.1 hypothetical protein DFJ58DRAFT_727835 [Suillus subalutaceus]